MNFKRIARALVCLVLVCALVVNISPIKTEAIVAEAVATYLGYGIVAALVLGTAGFVISPTGQDQLENLGHAFQTSMYQWGTSAEKLEEVEEFFAGLTLYNGGAGSGDDDDDIDHRFKIPEAIRRGVAAFTAAAILAGSLVVPDKLNEAPEGYAYYNGHLLPEVDLSTRSYWYLVFQDDVYHLHGTNQEGYIKLKEYNSTTSKYLIYQSSSDNLGVYGPWYKLVGQNWSIVNQSFGFSDPTGLVWANFDLLNDTGDIVFSGMEPTSTATTFVEPDIYVGDIPDKVKDGSVTEDTLVLPIYEFDYTSLATGNPDLAVAVTDLLSNVANGSITYKDYLSEFGAVPLPDPLPDPEPEPEPDPTTGADDLILGDIKTNTFFETLTDVVTAPFKWIWEKLDTKLDILKPPEFDFDKLTPIVTVPAEWIWPKLETFFEPLLNPDTLLDPLPDILEVPFRKTWEYVQAIPQEIADSAKELATEIKAIPEKLAEVGTNIVTHIQALPNYISDAATQVKNAVESLVVPDEDYLTDKVNALCEEFAFADSIVKTAKELKVCLAGVTTEPPVIYINLGATRGSYDIGGTVPFLDLRWYAEYKPTVDSLISAFLWICFVWRMLVKLPGIISGMPGDFVMTGVHHIGMTDALPVRKKEYEVQRMSNREMIRKGPDK